MSLPAELDLLLRRTPRCGGCASSAAPFNLSQVSPVADQEPITPIPLQPAADPLKLALGERLFRDPRLSEDGKLTCASCRDLQTNGAGGKAVKAPSDDSKPIDTLTVLIVRAIYSFANRLRSLIQSARILPSSASSPPSGARVSSNCLRSSPIQPTTGSRRWRALASFRSAVNCGH
jgi:hypothetical protein